MGILYVEEPPVVEDHNGLALITVTSGEQDIQFVLSVHSLGILGCRAGRVAGEMLAETRAASVVEFKKRKQGRR